MVRPVVSIKAVMASEKPPGARSRGGAGTFLADDHGGTFGDIAADDFRDAAVRKANTQLYGARWCIAFLHPNRTRLACRSIPTQCGKARALVRGQHRIQARDQALAGRLRLLAPCIGVLRECCHAGAHFRACGFDFIALRVRQIRELRQCLIHLLPAALCLRGAA